MQRRNQQQWQQLFAEQATSGLSAQQFCRDKNLCAKYFSLRKKQLAWRDSAAAFVPARLSGTSHPAMTPSATPVLIMRHHACTVQFSSLPDPGYLAQLLSTLS